jgi:penicillin-insensitive murein DD-endopeptidase
MGLRRWLTTMTCLATAGVAMSRPDDIARLATHLLSGFVVPLHAQQSTSTDTQALPDFIPGAHQLTFKPDGKPDGKADDSKGDADGTELSPLAAPSDAQSAAAPPIDLPEQAAPQSAPRAAAIAPVVIENGSLATTSRTAAITIEPDPTARSTDGPPAAPSAPPAIPAKQLFGAAKAPAPLAARAIGTYARGCLAGGVALPVDGPAWQAMRLSRNRNWGHPNLVKLVEQLALDSQKQDKWPGLLVGDISQPRGGPMLTGHASHQLGLDADVWLTPMPDKRLSRKEREELNATSMLDSTDLAVDPRVFTPAHVQLIKRAASYPQVERVLVHPAIKKALCEAAGADRAWLGKVRPIQGHYYHFHIRIGCPAGSAQTCTPQKPTTGEDGCGKEVQEWLARLAPSKTPPAPRPPGWKPAPPTPPITLAQLPQECTAVLETGPGGVDVPPEAKINLKAIARAPAALKPHLRKLQSAKN